MMPRALESAIYGLVSTPAVHSAIKYGIFSSLVEQGSADVESLADRVEVDADTLERILLVLTALGVIRRSERGEFSIIDAAVPYLDEGNSQYLGGFLGHLAEETHQRLPRIEEYLVNGKSDRSASPFSEMYRDPDSLASFMQAMWSLSFGPSKELAILANLDDNSHLVDIGGATGPFAVAALLNFPGLRATILDFPEVGSLISSNEEARLVADRLDFIGLDFFKQELPSADCYAFGFILSDWDDETSVTLLENAYRACQTPGKVLVMDRLFDADFSGPLATAAMNLVMHIEMAGRHRTAAEFIGLLERAGFVQCEVHRGSGEKHLIVGHKVE